MILMFVLSCFCVVSLYLCISVYDAAVVKWNPCMCPGARLINSPGAMATTTTTTAVTAVAAEGVMGPLKVVRNFTPDLTQKKEKEREREESRGGSFLTSHTN